MDIKDTSENSVSLIVSWFYTQTGSAGVILLVAAACALVFYLLRWQISRQGVKRVAQVYSVGILLITALHLAQAGNSTTGISAIPDADAESPPQAQVVTPAVTAKETATKSKTETALEQLRKRLEGQRAAVAAPPVATEQIVEVEEFDWLNDYGVPALWWAFGLGIVLYIVRAHPEVLSRKWLKRYVMLSKWIRPNRSSSNELGSGDFANTKQIKRWVTANDEYDTNLPVTDLRGAGGIIVKNGTLVFARPERNRHMLIIAKTGSGKTTKLILPILYNDCMCPHRSTIVIDSKQEMWSKLAAMTRKHNPHKNLILFNPLDAVRSLSWNILSKVGSDTDCKLIANSVIMATDEPQARQDSPFFRNSALQILNAMMVGLMGDPNEQLSMPRIHELISKGMHALCDWLEAHPVAIRTTKAFVELARSGSQNADTIMSELSMRLQAWDLKTIRSTTFVNEIDIEKIILEPSLFVVELRESELKMLRPLANVIVVELLRYLTKYAEECRGQSLPRPVGLVVDEFASALGRLPDIHIKLNTLRSRNVSIVAAIQSIGQIKGNYGEDWESVISGFSTKIFMPSLDYTDSEWASKESGIMTVRYRTSSKGTNRKVTENFSHNNNSINEQIQQRAVLTPDEIGRPAESQQTFFLPETPVFQGHLTPYYKIPLMHKRLHEFSKPEHEVQLRTEPIQYEEILPEAILRNEDGSIQGATTNADGLSDKELWSALEEVKVKQLDWENTSGDARKWWEAFEEENKERIALVLKVAHEISKRQATITDFFLAYVYSNTDNIQATLAYLDYTMHMKANEQQNAVNSAA